VNPHSGMFQGIVRLQKLGFSPSGILDIGAYEGDFARAARQIFPDSYILMVDALAEKERALADACRVIGNADYLITLLGAQEGYAAPFFVVDTVLGPTS
jgi:hypothetical protein